MPLRSEPSSRFQDWPLDTRAASLWETSAASLRAKLAARSVESVSLARELVLRAAVIDYVTRDLAENDSLSAVEAELQAPLNGRLSDRQNTELQALARGDALINEAASSRMAITEEWLKNLHVVLCQPQRTHSALNNDGVPTSLDLVKGEYRVLEVGKADVSGWYEYLPASSVPNEIRRLFDQLRSRDFALAHPLVQAAFSLHALCWIHPFTDGNGRVARGLASIYTQRSAGVPLLVFSDQREEYADGLEQASRGNPGPLVDFVSSTMVAVMALFEQALDATQSLTVCR